MSFANLVSIVDENIILNNDKTNVDAKSWEEICRILSNYGKIIY